MSFNEKLKAAVQEIEPEHSGLIRDWWCQGATGRRTILIAIEIRYSLNSLDTFMLDMRYDLSTDTFRLHSKTG